MRTREIVREKPFWLLAGISLVLFWRPLTTETLFFRDLYHLYIPKKLQLAASLRDGVLPFWDVLVHGGQPFFASPQTGVLFPLNILLFLPDSLRGFNLLLVMLITGCALAAYWLARVLSLGPLPALVAAAIYGFSGASLSTVNLPILLTGLPWIPLALGLTYRAATERRSTVPAVLCAAMPLLGGSAEVAAMLFVVVIVAVLAMAASRRTVVLLLVLGTGAVGLTLVQTLPVLTTIAQSSRSGPRSYDSFTSWSVHPRRLPELVVPRYFGDTDTMVENRYWGRTFETSGFPYILSIYFGLPVLILAIAGSAGLDAGDRVPRRTLTALACIGMVLSLGRYLPGFSLIYDHVPLVTTFRYPVKAMFAALLPISLLAARGTQVLALSRRGRLIAGNAALAMACVSAAVAIFAHRSSIGTLERFFGFEGLPGTAGSWIATSFLHTAVTAGLFALICAAQRLPLMTMLAGLVAADITAAGFHVNPSAPRSIFEAPPIAAAVNRARDGGRFYAAQRQTIVRAPSDELMWLVRWQIATLDGYNAALFGIPVIFHEDYDGLAPARMARMSRTIEGIPWDRRKVLLDRANVRVFTSPTEVPWRADSLLARLSNGEQTIYLYSNLSAVPGRFAGAVEIAANDTEALRKLLNDPDPTRVILESAPAGSPGGCGTAPIRVLSRSAERVLYSVDAPCHGYVVFSENHYPGWEARVDSVSAEIIPADYGFSAVAVGPGRHHIERRYVPPGSAAGSAGSLATLFLLGLFEVGIRRRRKSSAGEPVPPP